MRVARILAAADGRAHAHRAARHRRPSWWRPPSPGSRTTPTGRRCWPSRWRPWPSPGWPTSSRSRPSRSASASGPRPPACCSRRSATCPSSSSSSSPCGRARSVVAQTSIIGSIFANALLVLGLVIVFGARAAPDGTMRFRPRLPNDTATLLLVTSFIIVLVGLAHATHEPAARHEREMSAIAAVALLGVYLAWVVPYVRSEAAGEPRSDARARAWRWAWRSACWRRAAWARPSSRTGSSPRCGRPSTSSASRRRSPAWSWWRWPATRSRTSPASCWPTRARPTSRSRSSRTRWRRSRPSCTRCSCSSRCSSPTSSPSRSRRC